MNCLVEAAPDKLPGRLQRRYLSTVAVGGNYNRRATRPETMERSMFSWSSILGLRFRPSAPAESPMPIVVGSPRSGTTMLRFMLDAHPVLAIPPEIERLLPEARFIHIVRDGRDVAVSLRKFWFSPGHDVRIQARFWRDNVLIARQQGAACRHYREVHFEDLLCDPESVLRCMQEMNGSVST